MPAAAHDVPAGVSAVASTGAGGTIHIEWTGIDSRDVEVNDWISSMPLYCLIKPIFGLALLCRDDWRDHLELAVDRGPLEGTSVHDLLGHRAGLRPSPYWSAAFMAPEVRAETVASRVRADPGWRDGYAYSDLDAWIIADSTLRSATGSGLWQLLADARESVGLGAGIRSPDAAPDRPLAADWISGPGFRTETEFFTTDAWRTDPTAFVNAEVFDVDAMLGGVADAVRYCRQAGDERFDAFTNRGTFTRVGYDHARGVGGREYGIGTMCGLGTHHRSLRGLVGHYTWRGTSGLFIEPDGDNVVLDLRLGVESAFEVPIGFRMSQDGLDELEPIHRLGVRVGELPRQIGSRVTFDGVNYDASDGELIEIVNRSRILSRVVGRMNPTRDGLLGIAERRLDIWDGDGGGTTSIGVPMWRFDDGTEPHAGGIPLYPFGALVAGRGGRCSTVGPVPTFILRVREWHEVDLDIRFSCAADGSIGMASIERVHASAAPVGISVRYPDLRAVAVDGGDIRSAITADGATWGPLDLILAFGGRIQTLIGERRPTDDDVAVDGIIDTLVRRPVTQRHTRIPSLGDVEYLTLLEQQSSGATPDTLAVMVVATETTSGWRNSLVVSHDVPDWGRQEQWYWAPTIFDALRTVTGQTNDVGLEIVPLSGEPTVHTRLDDEALAHARLLGIA